MTPKANRMRRERAAQVIPPAYNLGDPVKVAYPKDKPEEAQIVSGQDLFGRTILASYVTNCLFFVGTSILGVIAIGGRIKAMLPRITDFH